MDQINLFVKATRPLYSVARCGPHDDAVSSFPGSEQSLMSIVNNYNFLLTNQILQFFSPERKRSCLFVCMDTFCYIHISVLVQKR